MLARILGTRRAHGSDPDRAFRLWLFNSLRLDLHQSPEIKEEGCIYVTTDSKSTVLFSCHVDTVHGTAESNENPKQDLMYDAAFGHLFLNKESKSGCLGGDDGVGVYLMLEMIRKKVPGHYMFHTGEERGGIGSRAFVQANTKFLESIEQVVAFDRAVKDGENPEIIHTQGGKQCASFEYTAALGKALSEAAPFELPYVPSHRGSFTDSKVYADYVPECVNVGCFYVNQHTPNEVVDVVGVQRLLQAVCAIDWTKLPVRRKPVAPSQQVFDDGYHYGLYDRQPAKTSQAKPKQQPLLRTVKAMQQPSLIDELADMTYEDLYAYIEEESYEAVTFVLGATLSRMKAAEDASKRMQHFLGVD